MNRKRRPARKRCGRRNRDRRDRAALILQDIGGDAHFALHGRSKRFLDGCCAEATRGRYERAQNRGNGNARNGRGYNGVD